MEVESSDLSGFSAFLLRNGRKQTTIYRHINCLKLLAQNCSNLSAEEIERFLVRLKSEGKRHSYLNHFTGTARIYCEYRGWEIPQIQRWNRQSFLKATMSDEEIEAFLALPCPIATGRSRKGELFTRPTDPKRWIKLTVFWKICAFTGMRPGEVAHLEANDVDMGRKVFIVRESKTGEPRVVPMAPNLESAVLEHLAGLKGKFLFPSARGGNHNGTGAVIDSVDWHYDFHKRINRLGIRRTNLTPYSLRHSLITRLLEEDVNLFKVQRIVGHRRVETTAQYTHLTTKDIQEAIRKHPIIRRSTDPKSILTSIVALIKSFGIERDPRFDYKIEESEDELVFRVKIKK